MHRSRRYKRDAGGCASGPAREHGKQVKSNAASTVMYRSDGGSEPARGVSCDDTNSRNIVFPLKSGVMLPGNEHRYQCLALYQEMWITHGIRLWIAAWLVIRFFLLSGRRFPAKGAYAPFSKMSIGTWGESGQCI